MDKIHAEFLKALDVADMPLQYCVNIEGLCLWGGGGWVVVPLFKKGGQRICLNYRGITLLGLPGKMYSRVLERRVRLLASESRGAMAFSSWKNWTDSIPT